MGHEISDENLNDIIDTCELNRIINKKIYGLDNYLYGGGSELSGGERQLIFLARSLVLDKQIIILDETLSEVNDAVEDKILNKLFTKYKDKTIIYVSHKNKKNYFKNTIYV
jgi:ABC-type transport system involved in cytochrome bd biosynthesis fused ATPase/permease subunit